MWILESIPLLHSTFSTVIPIPELQQFTPALLCEKYTATKVPSLIDVLNVESNENVSFYIALFLYILLLLVKANSLRVFGLS